MVSTHEQRAYHPLRLAYATTIYNAQGKTLKQAIIWFEIDNLSGGCGYVAVSQVKRLRDTWFLTPPKASNFYPVV